MPGAGSSPAGAGPAGFDPVAPLAPPRARSAPLAALIDPRTRDIVVRADGVVAATHPVDQQVTLAIIVAQGTLRSAPAVGQTLSAITYGGKSLEGRVSNAVRLALAGLVSNGDVAIRTIAVNAVDGGFLFVLTYTNLRTSKLVTITAPV